MTDPTLPMETAAPLSEFGKIGVLCIAPTYEEAEALSQRATEALDPESDAV